MIEITRIRHRWAEKKGFLLNRPQGTGEYILLHFLSPANLTWQGQTRRTAPGDVIVFAPGDAHCIFAAEPLLHDWMHLRGEVDDLLDAFGLQTGELYHVNNPSGMTDLFALLEMEFFARLPYWRELAQARLTELMVQITRSLIHTPMQLSVRVETKERLREIRTRMLSEPWHNWSIPELAENAHISQSRLQAVYKSIFGIPPKRDLILMKVEKAKQLLHGGMSVTETAEALGYSNVYHFIRQFKQITGSSPGQHREAAHESDPSKQQ